MTYKQTELLGEITSLLQHAALDKEPYRTHAHKRIIDAIERYFRSSDRDYAFLADDPRKKELMDKITQVFEDHFANSGVEQ